MDTIQLWFWQVNAEPGVQPFTFRQGRNKATTELELHIDHFNFKKAPIKWLLNLNYIYRPLQLQESTETEQIYPAPAGAAHHIQESNRQKELRVTDPDLTSGLPVMFRKSWNPQMPTATPIAANSGYTCARGTKAPSSEGEREREHLRACVIEDTEEEEAHLGSDPAVGHRSRRLFGLGRDRDGDGGEGWGKVERRRRRRGSGRSGWDGFIGEWPLGAYRPKWRFCPRVFVHFLFSSGCPLFAVHRNYFKRIIILRQHKQRIGTVPSV